MKNSSSIEIYFMLTHCAGAKGNIALCGMLSNVNYPAANWRINILPA